jgi:transcriptional regulator with XRE-family HTH domain
MNALKYQRIKNGMKQYEVAQKIGIHPTRLSKLEMETAWMEPRKEELSKLSILYGVKKSALLREVEFGK